MTLERNAMESVGSEVAGTDLAALGFGVVSLTFPFSLSLDSAPINCLHVAVVIKVPLTEKASSESNFGTLCRMQTLEINKGKKRLLLPFSMHLKVSSTMILPTLIYRPMMIECGNSICSSDMESLCDVDIKLALRI
ncbi:hypothetical protein V6N12_069092 [Hibiscus sabdariffa]|uniref:Uncharacterized protein n=1 Tax=Hibiscus sabdariffa TaxID=183260 RepID=A0ABR2FCU1_9ROSI